MSTVLSYSSVSDHKTTSSHFVTTAGLTLSSSKVILISWYMMLCMQCIIILHASSGNLETMFYIGIHGWRDIHMHMYNNQLTDSIIQMYNSHAFCGKFCF